MAFYKFNQKLKGRSKLAYELSGFVILFLIWFVITMGENPIVLKGILPSPRKMLSAFHELLTQNDLIPNFFYSLGLNLGGYVEALFIAIPLGFLMGLVPKLRATFERPIDAVRFLVLPASVGIFIAWFGIGSWMRVHFLAFGIIIYLLPTAIQRVDDVNDIYLKTVYTLGASKWQMIRTVYFPAVISKLFSDIRILTAISWTYIVIAEAIGGEAGIGALTWQVGFRRGRIDKVFCLLVIIMLVGIMQDKLFGYLDKKLFPHKYQAIRNAWEVDEDVSVGESVWDYVVQAISWIFIAIYIVLVLDELFGLLGHLNLLSYLFRDTVWVIHFLMLSLLAFKIRSLIDRRNITNLNSIPADV